MLDIKIIRAQPDRLREAIRLRNVDPAKADLDRWLTLDEQRRQLQLALDQCNAEKNKLAQLGRADPAAARERGQGIRQRARDLEAQLDAVTAAWQTILDWFP